jgi:hypothetical protein
MSKLLSKLIQFFVSWTFSSPFFLVLLCCFGGHLIPPKLLIHELNPFGLCRHVKPMSGSFVSRDTTTGCKKFVIRQLLGRRGFVFFQVVLIRFGIWVLDVISGVQISIFICREISLFWLLVYESTGPEHSKNVRHMGPG